MSTIALASARISPRQHTRSIGSHHLLLAVLAWDLRRVRGSRLFWLQALSFFCLLLVLMWYGRMPAQFEIPTASGFVAATSAWGMLMTLPIYTLLLALLLPFVNADGVTRDLSRRTRELLGTTPLPGWAYVWGRYLSGLLVSLGLATLLLAATLGMGAVLHLTITDYPAPVPGTVLLLWVGMVVPTTVLVSSFSFALGTVFPQHTTLIKISIMLAWIGGAVVLPDLLSRPALHNSLPAWYVNWDPTGRATAIGMVSQYETPFNMLSKAATSSAQMQGILDNLENKAPDVSAWLAPHLVLAGLSLLLVVLAAFGFRRFRGAFGA
jgi:ABC-type transport system involved in multi-copper enzyme maturation permease subunit